MSREVMIEYWQDLTTTDFGTLNRESTLVILPVAAVEQHGPHLPLGTDLLINRGILAAAEKYLTEGIRVLVLPEQAVGDSLEHSAFAGTLTLQPESLLMTWTAIGCAVARSGLRKLVIFNSHGGQTGLVDQVALRLRVEQRMLVVRANYFAFPTPPGLFSSDELAYGLHGGELETSILLHLHPELVRRDALRDFAWPDTAPDALLQPERPVGYGWMSQDLNPTGAVGNAAHADAERGSHLLDHLGRSLAVLLSETAAMSLDALRDGPETG
jgi:creatinine amidohydrolase